VYIIEVFKTSTQVKRENNQKSDSAGGSSIKFAREWGRLTFAVHWRDIWTLGTTYGRRGRGKGEPNNSVCPSVVFIRLGSA
jgi:hypothetical protein